MKAYTLLLCIAFFLVTSACKKEGLSTPLTARTLPGTWELRAISGGNVANPALIRPGNGDKWVFTETRYQKYYNDTVFQSGDYLVSRGTGTDPNTPRPVDEILLGTQGRLNVELVNDTLKFFYGPIAADGYITKYVRIQ